MTRHLKKLEGVATSNARTTINVPLVALVPMDQGEFEQHSGNGKLAAC
jgi:hypothetical protein